MVKGADGVEDEDAVYCLFVRMEVGETKVEGDVPSVVWVAGMISSCLIILPQGNIPSSAGYVTSG
jgi:hypothetical protein